MRVEITDACILCNVCAEICPAIFEMGDEIADVKVDRVPQGYQADVRRAANECPSEAIIITREER